jgi:hypothetical protein
MGYMVEPDDPKTCRLGSNGLIVRQFYAQALQLLGKLFITVEDIFKSRDVGLHSESLGRELKGPWKNARASSS